MKLTIPQGYWDQLQQSVRTDGVETVVIALATLAHTPTSQRLLLRELRFPADGDYAYRGATGAQVTPRFVAETVADARRLQLSCVFIHTHPLALEARFSQVDDAGERVLAKFLSQRVPDRTHVAVVVTPHHSCARILGTNVPIDVTIVGAIVRQELATPEREHSTSAGPSLDNYDRQVRALGRDAQRRLQSLTIAIVGLGGTGSVAAQQLAHLGVRDFVLVDPDTLDRTNLNRVVGANATRIGRPKVDVAADHLKDISADVRCTILQDNIVHNSILATLVDVDAIFCCTDSHGSRYVLNELAYRYLIPCFDVGVAIVVSDRVTHISGRAQLLSPGLPCLTCQGTLDPSAVRRDLMSDSERARDPYIIGAHVPEPAVISINSTVVSLATTMFLATFARLPSLARHIRYDGIACTVRPTTSAIHPGCVTCSPQGAYAWGDSWPLPGRPS